MAHQSDENNPIVNGPPISRGGMRIGGGKALARPDRSRRTLGDISNNAVAARQVPQAMNKRECPERNMVSNNNPPVPRVHRPVTRRFAAALSSKQPQPLDTKRSTSVDTNASKLDSKPSESDDCIIIDAVEDAEVSDSKAPMSMQDNEVFDKIDEMEEDSVVELEIVMAQPPTEPIRRYIDGDDVNNPLAVVEYIGEIYAFHKRIERSSCVLPNYMNQQFDINGRMRAILMDWLIEVHYKFELLDETLFLMINVIDRFLAQKSVERKKLQLVGVTGLLLACKYEEVQVPIVEDLVLITDKAYSRKEILTCSPFTFLQERLMVNTLQFNMSVPTPFVFMRRFLKVAQANRRLELVAFYLVELSLVEYEMLRFPPSLLAAAAIFTAQCTINRIRNWTATSEWHTTYSEVDLMECSKMMVSFHQNAASGKLTGVHRKYIFKYGYGAVSEPALFLLEKTGGVEMG